MKKTWKTLKTTLKYAGNPVHDIPSHCVVYGHTHGEHDQNPTKSMSPMEKNEHSGFCFWERLCFLRLSLRPLVYIIYYSDFLVAHTKAFAICYNCNYQPYLFQLWTVVDVSVKQDLIRQCVHFWTKRFLFGTRNHFGVLGPPPIDFLSYLSTEIATYIA